MKVVRSTEALEMCFECLTQYTDAQESLWSGCDHCNDRWVCGNSDCQESLEKHEKICRERRLERESKHQEAVKAAPRVNER